MIPIVIASVVPPRASNMPDTAPVVASKAAWALPTVLRWLYDRRQLTVLQLIEEMQEFVTSTNLRIIADRFQLLATDFNEDLSD